MVLSALFRSHPKWEGHTGQAMARGGSRLWVLPHFPLQKSSPPHVPSESLAPQLSLGSQMSLFLFLALVCSAVLGVRSKPLSILGAAFSFLLPDIEALPFSPSS